MQVGNIPAPINYNNIIFLFAKYMKNKTIRRKINKKVNKKTKPKITPKVTKRTNKTHNNKKPHVFKSKTPRDIERASLVIAKSLKHPNTAHGIENPIQNHVMGFGKISSYAPTINQDLVSLKSIPREKISDCNNSRAFKLEEPLKIAIPGAYYGNNCHKYSTPEAQKFLLHNLSANKHVDPSVIVPPIQIQSNCWFNTMFATLFISDKGRKFFHYFRELMIESKQANGTPIPEKLADAFALLNFAIESALTGSKYAYELNTNSIIKQIYESIPDKYHKIYPYVVGVDAASNPIRYYGSIITYLDEHSLQFLFISQLKTDWRNRVEPELGKLQHKPHIIILEIFDDESKKIEKPESFSVLGAEYKLDSCVIRDTTQQHFCATITCDGEEMGYDGMSFHRLVPMKWKDTINQDKEWGFEGSDNSDGTPLKWSFKHGYQLLLYYRVK
jgi:hypothetical protein